MKNALLITIVFFACFALSGCRAVRVIEQVPVPVHDTLRVVQVQADSVYIDRWHTVETKGDTVFDVRIEYVYRQKVVTDTITSVKEVPVEVMVEKIEEIKKPLPWWQKGLMYSGALFIALCCWRLCRVAIV